MNRRDFLLMAGSAVVLLPVASAMPPKRDLMRESIQRLQQLTPNGVVTIPLFRKLPGLHAEDFADAFALVERYDLRVDGVFLNPVDWGEVHSSVGSCTTRVLDTGGGFQVARLWSAKVWAHPAVPLGTVYAVGSQGLETLTDQGTTIGLSLIRLRAADPG